MKKLLIILCIFSSLAGEGCTEFNGFESREDLHHFEELLEEARVNVGVPEGVSPTVKAEKLKEYTLMQTNRVTREVTVNSDELNNTYGQDRASMHHEMVHLCQEPCEIPRAPSSFRLTWHVLVNDFLGRELDLEQVRAGIEFDTWLERVKAPDPECEAEADTIGFRLCKCYQCVDEKASQRSDEVAPEGYLGKYQVLEIAREHARSVLLCGVHRRVYERAADAMILRESPF